LAKRENIFRIYGRVLHAGTHIGIPNLLVKAMDKDLFFDDLLGVAVTDQNGYFEIKYDKSDFRELFFDQQPDIYLVIMDKNGKVIFTSRETIIYNADTTEEFTIILPKELTLTKTSIMTAKTKVQTLNVQVELQELKKEHGWPKIALYAFSRSGRLLDKQKLKPAAKTPNQSEGKLQIKTNLKTVLLKLGPDIEDASRLEKYQPHTMRVTLPIKDNLRIDLNESIWICWLHYAYHVKGTIKKSNGNPICVGEVDIYDVDLRRCFYSLPDFVIEYIRDGFIDLIEDPPPIEPKLIDFRKPMSWWDWDDDDWCPTKPKPPFPPKLNLENKLVALPQNWSFSLNRYRAIPEAKTRLNTALQKMDLSTQRNFLDTEFADGLKVSQILYTNTTQFRTMLIENFIVIRYWLCWWPWIYWYWWPYCSYSLEKLGTATLQADGSFSKIVWLSVCRNDIPDLWFKVRQKVGGVEKVIYAKHPVPCNTYWNHDSDDPIDLVVAHPDAVACAQPNPGLEDAYVLPMGIYEDEWYEINNSHIKAACNPTVMLPNTCGLYNSGDPYGTRLDFRMQFHEDIYFNNIRYYRWSYRLHGNTDWNPINTPISHRYITEPSPGDYVITSENMGPVNIGTGTDLFKVPDPDLSWLDNRNDLAFAIWHTAIWDNDLDVYVPQVADGKYDLRLEMFDNLGNKVTPAAGFKFILPTAPLGTLDDGLFIEADGSLVMHLHIDNKDTIASINEIGLNGVPVGDCQFIEYEHIDTDQVTIKYVAYHPTTTHNFLDHYNLNIKRGISGTTMVSISETIPAPVEITKSYFVKDLLGVFSRCAFSVNLHTWPRTRNGHGRIRAYEAHDNSAFAIVERYST
jgi:hypothetical protein